MAAIQIAQLSIQSLVVVVGLVSGDNSTSIFWPIPHFRSSWAQEAQEDWDEPTRQPQEVMEVRHLFTFQSNLTIHTFYRLKVGLEEV